MIELPIIMGGRADLKASHIGKFQGKITADVMLEQLTNGGSEGLVEDAGAEVVYELEVLVCHHVFRVVDVVLDVRDGFVDLAQGLRTWFAHLLDNHICECVTPVRHALRQRFQLLEANRQCLHASTLLIAVALKGSVDNPLHLRGLDGVEGLDKFSVFRVDGLEDR